MPGKRGAYSLFYIHGLYIAGMEWYVKTVVGREDMIGGAGGEYLEAYCVKIYIRIMKHLYLD